MPKLTIKETDDLLKNVESKLSGDMPPLWGTKFAQEFLRGINWDNTGIHLAIIAEPYLSLILKGEKTIESRFTKNRIAPFGQAKAGDIILLKKSGGGIVGVAEIEQAIFIDYKKESLHTPFYSIHDTKIGFNDKICATSEFWESKAESRYASLLWLKNVATLSEPIPFPRQHGSAWLILS